MEKKIIHSDHAPEAIRPYSQAVEAQGAICFVSGQLPIDPATGQFAGDSIEEQTEQALKNIQAILEAGGLTMANVVKTTVLQKDIADFGAMNEVYARFFERECRARAASQVAAIPKGAPVEIEAVAVR